jgi:hypothetical protein
MSKAKVQTPAADAPLQERALWVLERLRKEPGVVVEEEEGCRWLQLEYRGSLNVVIERLFPGQSLAQRKGLNAWLGANGLRGSLSKGRRGAVHFIKLPDEDERTVEAAEPQDVVETLKAAAELINKQRETIRQLREQFAITDSERQASDAENDMLKQKVVELEQDIAELRERLTAAENLSSGIDELRQAIAG